MLWRMEKNQPKKLWHDFYKEILKERGISIADIAAKVSSATGSHTDTVYKWLRGDREPSFEDFRTLAWAIGLSAGELLEPDGYYIKDDQERALIDRIREMDPEERNLFFRLFLPRKQPQL